MEIHNFNYCTTFVIWAQLSFNFACFFTD